MDNDDKRRWLADRAVEQADVLRNITDGAENRMLQRQALEHAARARWPDDDDADDASVAV